MAFKEPMFVKGSLLMQNAMIVVRWVGLITGTVPIARRRPCVRGDKLLSTIIVPCRPSCFKHHMCGSGLSCFYGAPNKIFSQQYNRFVRMASKLT